MTIALAPQPTRASNSITLAFSLVNIPLSVYTTTETTRVERKEFVVGTDVPVGRAPIRKDTGKIIDPADVVRKAEASNGTWVTLTDDEVMACTSPRGVAQVEAFVPLVKIRSSYVVEGMYQVRPKRVKGKPDPAAEKAFAVLVQAMREKHVAALVTVAMRGPARPALILPTGEMLLVVPCDGVRQALPMPTITVTEAEAEMASNLIDAIGIGVPTITDETAVKVAAFVDAKAGGVTPPPPAAPTQTDDVMAAMMASIKAAQAATKGVAA